MHQQYLEFSKSTCDDTYNNLIVKNLSTLLCCYLPYIYIQILFGCQTELYYLQVSGPLLLPLALGHLPVFSSPSLQLMTTRQCCLEETNHDIAWSMSAILWTSRQWYAQRDTAVTQYQLFEERCTIHLSLNMAYR